MDRDTQYYYNLSTGQVEQGRQSPGSELMGPYTTRSAAERALQTAAARNETWDEDQKEWDADYGDEPPAPSAPTR